MPSLNFPCRNTSKSVCREWSEFAAGSWAFIDSYCRNWPYHSIHRSSLPFWASSGQELIWETPECWRRSSSCSLKDVGPGSFFSSVSSFGSSADSSAGSAANDAGLPELFFQLHHYFFFASCQYIEMMPSLQALMQLKLRFFSSKQLSITVQ